MTTATETFMSQNNDGQGGDMNFSASTGGMDLNLGGSGPILQSTLPMEGGMAFGASGSSAMAGTTTTTTNTQHFTSSTGEVGLPPTGTLMGIGGGVGDNAQDVTYSTKSNQGFAFGTGGAGQTTTTTTTTTTQYGAGAGGAGEGGLLLGVGGEGAGAGLGLGAGQTTTTTSTTYGISGEGAGSGLLMGVGGGVGDEAADVTYSTKTGAEGAG